MRPKRGLADLAAYGGPPAFPEPLHVGRPNVPGRAALLARLNDTLDRRWLTNNGRYVLEFERRLAERVGVAHCVATANATLGLQLLVRGLALAGEVILPAFTFVADAHALCWEGLTPVFCDIEPERCTLDPARVEELITPRTGALLGVHLWGNVCDVPALERIAARHGLPLIFDAAHALGCASEGSPVGGFGAAEVFSFHATKIVNAFEGGAIATNDAALAERLRRLRNFGFVGPDEVASLGTNAKMSEAHAAMGLSGLECLDEFVDANRRNFAAYREVLAGIAGIRLAMPADRAVSNYHYVVIEIDRDRAGLSRDTLQAVLHAEGVLARRYFSPGCHRMEPYRSRWPHVGERLPRTERAAERLLALPTGTAVSPAAVAVVGDIIRLAARHAPTLAHHVGAGAR